MTNSKFPKPIKKRSAVLVGTMPIIIIIIIMEGTPPLRGEPYPAF